MGRISKVVNSAFNLLTGKIKLYKFKYKWKKNNPHNYTSVKVTFPDIAKVGNQTYGLVNVMAYGNENESLSIGHYCSIAEEVVFITGGNHAMTTFSQFPFDAYYNTGRKHQAPTKGPIVVEDDVWIGYGATIMSGVTIGQGAIIGARSMVTKDIPPYAVFVGNKVIKYRYPQNIIEKMIKFDFSKLTPAEVVENSDLLNVELSDSFFETDFYKQHLKD